MTEIRDALRDSGDAVLASDYAAFLTHMFPALEALLRATPVRGDDGAEARLRAALLDVLSRLPAVEARAARTPLFRTTKTGPPRAGGRGGEPRRAY